MIKTLLIKCHGQECGLLQDLGVDGYRFSYFEEYQGPGISLTMPVRKAAYDFERFPAFFDGLLPEGIQLEGLLRIHKIDQSDYMTQLLHVGSDLVGAITVEQVQTP